MNTTTAVTAHELSAGQQRGGLLESLDRIVHLLGTDPQMAATRAAVLLKRVPAQREALALFIDSRRLTNEMPAARNFLRAQSAAYPKLAAYHLALGMLFAEEGDLESAIASFSRVVELEPKNCHAWQALGDTLSENCQIREAVEAYSEALRLRQI